MQNHDNSKENRVSALLKKLRENPLFVKAQKSEGDIFEDNKDEEENNDEPRSLKNDSLRIQNQIQNQNQIQGKKSNETDSKNPQIKKDELDNKKLGEDKSKKVVEDILDQQIIGHVMAIREIQDKINAIQEEELARQNQSSQDSQSLQNKISARFISQKSAKLDPRQEELKMLADLLKESRKRVDKLQIKKNEEEFKRQMIEIMRESEELDSYNEYDAKRKGNNRVFLLPKEQVMSLSEIFGQADITHEVVEVPANQAQYQGLAEQNTPSQNQYQQNQVPQEQVMVIVVNDPQIIYQQQYQQGKEQISQGGSWVEMVKNSRSNQGQITSPSQSNNQVQGNSLAQQGSSQSQLQVRPVVGKFTNNLQSQRRAALVVMSKGK